MQFIFPIFLEISVFIKKKWIERVAILIERDAHSLYFLSVTILEKIFQIFSEIRSESDDLLET